MARESCFSVFPSSSWHRFESVSIYLGFMNGRFSECQIPPPECNWRNFAHYREAKLTQSYTWNAQRKKKTSVERWRAWTIPPVFALFGSWQFSIDCLKYLNWCPSFLSAAKCWKGIEFGWMDWNVDVVQWTLSPSPLLC